jgi:hypothetical protein
MQQLFSAETVILSSPDLCTPSQPRVHTALSLLQDGQLRVYSSSAPDEEGVFSASQARIRCARWTHLALVWYPRVGGHPNLRMFRVLLNHSLGVIHILGLYLDGVFVEGIQFAYPRSDSLGSPSCVQYRIGDHTSGLGGADDRSWCLASAYLFGLPLRM